MLKKSFPKWAGRIAAAAMVLTAAPAFAQNGTLTTGLMLPTNYPQLKFDGDQFGSRLVYTAADQWMKVDAKATRIQVNGATNPFEIWGGGTGVSFGTFTLRAKISASGNLIRGVESGDVIDGCGNNVDFCVSGTATATNWVNCNGLTCTPETVNGIPLTGVLLKGEMVDATVNQGFVAPMPPSSNTFEFYLNVTGGLLVDAGLYPTGSIVVVAKNTGQVQSLAIPPYSGTFASDFAVYADGDSWMTTKALLPIIITPTYTAGIQPPIKADSSSVFKKQTVPVKFTLAADGVGTCTLPAATISLEKIAGGTLGTVDWTVFDTPADSGPNFRIDATACQYIYNLDTRPLSTGTYAVKINIGLVKVGQGVFGVK